MPRSSLAGRFGSLGFIEPLPGAIKDGPHTAMMGVATAAFGSQKIQTVLDLSDDFGRREHFAPTRSQINRQRYPANQTTNLDDRGQFGYTEFQI